MVYSGRRLAYTVAGDAVNFVTRPHGITNEHGADIMVDAGARNAVREIVFRELDQVRVKGGSQDDTLTFKAKR